MSVFNRVLEEVESLNRKYAPVSYLASNSLNVFSVDEGSKNPSAPYIHKHTHTHIYIVYAYISMEVKKLKKLN